MSQKDVQHHTLTRHIGYKALVWTFPERQLPGYSNIGFGLTVMLFLFIKVVASGNPLEQHLPYQKQSESKIVLVQTMISSQIEYTIPLPHDHYKRSKDFGNRAL